MTLLPLLAVLAAAPATTGLQPPGSEDGTRAVERVSSLPTTESQPRFAGAPGSEDGTRAVERVSSLPTTESQPRFAGAPGSEDGTRAAERSALERVSSPPTSELDTARFKIHHTERATAAAQLLATEIEARRDEIRDVLGRDWPGVTDVYLGWGRSEYEALAPFGTTPPSWAAALAWPDENVVLLEAQSLAKGDGQETLRHELIHIALGRLGHHWPRWFQEGLAQHLTGERRFSVEHYTTIARAVAGDRVFKLDDLSAGFPERPSDVELAYAESSAFVLFLTERHPRAAFGDLVDGVGRGETFELAFAKAFHTSLNLEERTFREELPGRYPFWPIVTTGTTLWAFASLLVVVAYVRRRRVVLLKRAEQEAEEAAEDAAARILAAEQARALEALPPPPVEPPFLH